MSKMTDIMKKQWRFFAGVLGLVVIMAYSGKWYATRVQPGYVPVEPGLALPAGAQTVVAGVTNAPQQLLVIGTAASEEEVSLSARIPAPVREVFVSAGTRVTKGQVLLTLDDREIREQLTAAEAQLKQADAEFQRARQLMEKAATTDQALTAAESMFNTARANVDRVKVMLSYAQLTSPIDGIVTDRRIEVGNMANPGQPLISVYDPTRMRLDAPVPVRIVRHLALGQEVSVELERPARVFKGVVSEVVSEIDPASRTQMVKVHLEGVDGAVLPGTFGRMTLNGEIGAVIRIPASAVYRSGQLEFVQVVVGERVVRRLITTGAVQGDQVDVLSGLNAGERVLVQPVKGA